MPVEAAVETDGNEADFAGGEEAPEIACGIDIPVNVIVLHIVSGGLIAANSFTVDDEGIII